MAERVRLVVLSGSWPGIRCGTTPWIERVTGALQGTGRFDIHVVTSADEAVDREAVAGVTVHPEVKSWGPWRARGIAGQVLELEPEVVYMQNPTIKYTRGRSVVLSLVGPMLKRRGGGVRLVAMQHDIAIGRPGWRWRYYPYLRCAEAVVVTNRRDEQAVRAAGVAREKIHVAPLGSYTPLHERTAEARRRGREAFGIDAEAWCAVFFGFVYPGRHIETLVKALGVLKGEGMGVSGLILGGAGPGCEGYMGRCKALARELGLGEEVRFTGYASAAQIADGLAAADVFVSLPERGADMRNSSIVTGLQAGLPVITTRNPKYYVDPELDEMGVRYVEAEDAAGLAEEMKRVKERGEDEERVKARVERLDPERIWSRNAEAHLRAVTGEAAAREG